MVLQDRPRSRTELTFAALRRGVVGGEFLPGERLRIDQLGKRYEASIGAVREALSRLTAEGLVLAEPQKGFVVAPISRKDLTDLTEARVEVETRCLVASMANGGPAWEEHVQELQAKLDTLGPKPGDHDWVLSDEWHSTHEAFHDALTEACPNRWWLRIRRQLFLQSDRYRHYSEPIDGGARDVAAEHAAIVSAALARDGAGAGQAMSDHLWCTTTVLLESSLPFSEDT